jgi:structural maintenance of chromosome 1
VDERQSLDTLTRDEKTAQRVLAQLIDKQTQLEQRKTTLSEDAMIHDTKRSEVCS